MDISRIGALKTTKIPVVKARYLFSSNQEMIDTMRGKAALLGIALMVLCAAVIGNVTAAQRTIRAIPRSAAFPRMVSIIS